MFGRSAVIFGNLYMTMRVSYIYIYISKVLVGRMARGDREKLFLWDRTWC
ncbi:hypothetical protein SLEP1_g22605 [Rubroshorea leprosula]|uniref:Uncharacterized protein n=1 Tax=Rubroshorea leprosula TaxID=152421 RepID=A0AAV5JFU5_9ROSI|nr:hypothetical protein SLEP1_g22605 [Rubroshorea leprosula]